MRKLSFHIVMRLLSSRTVCLARAALMGLLFCFGWALDAGAQQLDPQYFTFTLNPNDTITITGYTGPGGDVTIPDTIASLPVTSIVKVNPFSHSSFSNLTGLTIGNSLISIGDSAFYHCTNLTNATLGNSVTNIGNSAFWACTSLNNITIGNKVATIGDGTFWLCTNLTAVHFRGAPPSFRRDVFSYATPTVYYLPGTTGWEPTFAGRPTALWPVDVPYTFSAYNGTITILGYTGPGGDITIPDTIAGLPVTRVVKANPFSDSNSFSNVTRVTIGNSVTVLGFGAFQHCNSLTNAIIGNGVTSIEFDAFWSCTNLASVTLGNHVANIADAAFSGCTSLTSVALPSSVTSLGSSAFFNCTSLTAIVVDPLNSFFSSADGVLFNKSQTTLLQYPAGKVAVAGSYNITNTVTIIGEIAFAHCISLTNITVPHSVTSIVDHAFYYCPGLISVTMGNSVATIGDRAFDSCPSLTGVYFQGDAPTASMNVFDNANQVIIYYLPGTTGWGPTFAGRPTTLWGQLPVADASATPMLVISGNGINAQAVLDGSRSFDPDGNALQYLWFRTSPEPRTLLGTGVVALVTLPVGANAIDLVVNVGLAANTNSVTVSVLTSSQAAQLLISMVNDSAVRNPQPLAAALSVAAASIARGSLVAAANQLRAFQNKVQVQVTDPDLARQLIAAAQQIIDSVGIVGVSDSNQVRLVPHASVKGRFLFTSAVGRRHIIEASTNLVDWNMIGIAKERDSGTFAQLLDANTTQPDSTFDFADPNASAFPKRYYRAMLLP